MEQAKIYRAAPRASPAHEPLVLDFGAAAMSPAGLSLFPACQLGYF